MQKLLSIFYARRSLVLFGGALLASLAGIIHLAVPAQYRATASVLVEAVPANAAFPQAAMLATHGDILSSERVARRVISRLRLLEGERLRARWAAETAEAVPMEQWLIAELRQALQIQTGAGSSVMKVGMVWGDARSAALLTNAFVQAYIDTVAELKAERAREQVASYRERTRALRFDVESAQRRLASFERRYGEAGSAARIGAAREAEFLLLEQTLESAQKAYETAVQRLAQTGALAPSQQAAISVLTRAMPPQQPDGPTPWFTVPLAALAGLCLGALLALLVESLQRRVRSGNDLVEHFGLPVLAVIGRAPGAPRVALLSPGTS